MGSPKGETPQTEGTVKTNKYSENGFPQRGDPTDKELFKRVRILKIDKTTPSAVRRRGY